VVVGDSRVGRLKSNEGQTSGGQEFPRSQALYLRLIRALDGRHYAPAARSHPGSKQVRRSLETG
jgi:hypothetical protein